MLNIPLKDYFRETRVFSSRLTAMAVSIVLVMLVLLGRLLYLQVVHHKHYATRSQTNRITQVPVPPVRGLILDRNGVVLAQNYPVYTLEIIPEQVEDMEAMIERLGNLVKLGDSDLEQFYKLFRTRPRFESLTIRTHLTDEEAARVAIDRPHLQGVELHARLQRHYPLGGLGVHTLGFVGRINEQEIERIDRSAYRGTRHIGKLGVEQNYEDTLLGKVGVEPTETNAHGRRLHIIERDRVAPSAGSNLYLNIDARMQAAAERALGDRRGSVVALDPRSGAILTFVSTPTYDPNPFVNGIDQESYAELLANLDKPLINRALSGRYSPGSTIKPFLALAALESGRVRPDDSITCRGWFSLPGDRHRYRDWKKRGHGKVDLHQALVQSCDVYFYKLAVTLGIDLIHTFLTHFGFGRLTGIDLKGESTGLVPSKAWREARKEKWYLGETVVTGIGQGPLLVTPLQLAVVVASLANSGIRLRPQLLQASENPVTKERLLRRPQYVSEIPIAEKENLDRIIASMTDVVHGKRGTARGIGWNAPYRIAGKTGTAQVLGVGQDESYDKEAIPERLRDHALFIAFAPVEDPRIAIAVIVENGGHGSKTAAPIARKLMDYWLLPNKMPSLPIAARS